MECICCPKSPKKGGAKAIFCNIYLVIDELHTFKCIFRNEKSRNGLVKITLPSSVQLPHNFNLTINFIIFFIFVSL